MSGVLPAVFQRKSRKKRCHDCDYEECACQKKKGEELDEPRIEARTVSLFCPACRTPITAHETAPGICEVRMDSKRGHPRFHQLLAEAADLHAAKSQDYGRSESEPLGNLHASKRIDIDPFMGVMIRMQDKWARIEALLRNNRAAVKTESMVDTLRDLAAYSYLAIILWEEEHGKAAV